MRTSISKLVLFLFAITLAFSACGQKNQQIAVESQSADSAADVVGESSAQPIASSDSAVFSDAEVSEDAYSLILKEDFRNLSGKYSYTFHMYNSGRRISVGEGRFKAASIIKLFIMDYAFSQIADGYITADTVIGSRKLSSLIESMITISDNSSTNALIDYFTMDKINAYIKSQGYTDTVLARRMLDTAAAARGEENYTSAKDVMNFLDNLYYGKDKFPQSEMISVMKRQQIATKLRRNMPAGVEIASKTGELSDTENDVAIVFTSKGDYAIVCLTQNCVSSQARDAMALSNRAIYDEIIK